MKDAILWRFFEKEYEPVKIDDRCKTYSVDMNELVVCPNCGCEVKFEDCYTSRRWHTKYGIGYAVCVRCYQQELHLEDLARRVDHYSNSRGAYLF